MKRKSTMVKLKLQGKGRGGGISVSTDMQDNLEQSKFNTLGKSTNDEKTMDESVFDDKHEDKQMTSSSSEGYLSQILTQDTFDARKNILEKIHQAKNEKMDDNNQKAESQTQAILDNYVNHLQGKSPQDYTEPNLFILKPNT